MKKKVYDAPWLNVEHFELASAVMLSSKPEDQQSGYDDGNDREDPLGVEIQ